MNNQYLKRRLNENASVVLHSTGKVYLHNVTIGVKGSQGNLLTIYDSADVSDLRQHLIIDTSIIPGTFHFEHVLENGLCIRMAGGTAADLVITYKPLS